MGCFMKIPPEHALDTVYFIQPPFEKVTMQKSIPWGQLWRPLFLTRPDFHIRISACEASYQNKKKIIRWMIFFLLVTRRRFELRKPCLKGRMLSSGFARTRNRLSQLLKTLCFWLCHTPKAPLEKAFGALISREIIILHFVPEFNDSGTFLSFRIIFYHLSSTTPPALSSSHHPVPTMRKKKEKKMKNIYL